MPQLTLDTTINDLVDFVYEEYDITEEWTSTMHRTLTDQVKRDAKKRAADGKSVGDAITAAIRSDVGDATPKFEWLSERLAEALTEQSVDPNTTEADAKRAHHERIDNERVTNASTALTALSTTEDVDSSQSYYAQIVILFYMNARAAFDEKTKRRTQGIVDVAGMKALAYAFKQHDDLSEDEVESLKQSISLGKKVLLDAIKENRAK